MVITRRIVIPPENVKRVVAFFEEITARKAIIKRKMEDYCRNKLLRSK